MLDHADDSPEQAKQQRRYNPQPSKTDLYREVCKENKVYREYIADMERDLAAHEKEITYLNSANDSLAKQLAELRQAVRECHEQAQHICRENNYEPDYSIYTLRDTLAALLPERKDGT